MTTSDSTTLIRAIHASSLRFVIAVTGGGSGAIARLLEVPGASRTVLEARVPYAAEALNDYLRAVPESYCSSLTTRAMAMTALERAKALDKSAQQPAGFSCTASLASDRPKRGAHRAYLAAQTNAATIVWSISLQKGQRSRQQEEQLVADILLRLIAETAGLPQQQSIELFEGERIEIESLIAPHDWQELLAGSRQSVIVCGEADGPLKLILPGAFNPLHQGHSQMAQLASKRVGAPCVFELSITNVDKPPLDFVEIHRRTKQFTSDQPIVLTRAPTFVEKSTIFPRTAFAVGADTVERVAAERYYSSEQAMHDAIQAVASAGCRFLVFGRTINGRFVTLDEMQLPTALRRICEQVPRQEFDETISSTELRRDALSNDPGHLE